MTLDDFVELQRLPTATELVSLCDVLGIRIMTTEDGKASIRVYTDASGNNKEGELLAKLMRREPWRSEILKLKAPSRVVECLWPGTGYIGAHNGKDWPVGAYYWRNAGDTDWKPIPGRTWDKRKD